MKNKILSKQILILTLINVVPILLLIIFIVDLKEAVLSPNNYSFSNSIHPSGSIYSSKETYIGFHSVQILTILLLIISSIFWFKRKKIYLVLLLINLFLLIYPTITMRD
jgi:hypothetical protein